MNDASELWTGTGVEIAPEALMARSGGASRVRQLRIRVDRLPVFWPATTPCRGYFCKRVLDMGLTSIAVLVALPALFSIGLAVKLQDGGPVLFKQTRVGREGRPFTIYKFRSMVANAEELKSGLLCHNEGAGHLFKMKADPRVTQLGRFLRHFSLDELPQLFNVLGGTMSLVGPRPHLADEVARMPPQAMRRSLVDPGITGLWQVSGRSDLDQTESVRLDLRYVDNWSLALDLLILWRTISVVLTARGAH